MLTWDKLNSRMKGNILTIILVATVFLASTFKTLGFYFWHDDFSSFYGARVGECIHTWPYIAFCPIFDFLVQLLGYSPFPYFLLGHLLAIFALTSFFIFVKNFWGRKVSIILTALFASGYIAGGVFLEAHGPIISFPTLALLFISLNLFIASLKNGLKRGIFVLASLVFAMSLTVFYARASSHLVPILTLILVFSRAISLRGKIILVVVTILTYLTFFFVLPGVSLSIVGTSAGIIGTATNFNDALEKVKYFLQTISSFLLTDYIQGVLLQKMNAVSIANLRNVIGFFLASLFVFFLLRDRKNSELFKIRIFSLIWIIFMYLPYSLRTDWRLESTHRYILWMYPGILMAWASFSRSKFWIMVTICLIFLNILQSNSFFGNHLKTSQNRSSFYSQIHDRLKNIPEGTILFFDFSQNMSLYANDFFRVGYTPPESALGTEYGVNYKAIKLITDSKLFVQKLLSKESVLPLAIDRDKLITFYWDGNNLTETTSKSREILKSRNEQVYRINKSQTTDIAYETKTGKWLGKNDDINFQVNNFILPIPVKIELKMRARNLDTETPYSHECLGCVAGVSQNLSYYLDYLRKSRLLTNLANIVVSNAGEETIAESLTDSDLETYWLADRQKWFQGEKPVLEMNFPHPISLNGIIFFSTSNSRSPSSFKVGVNGQPVDYISEEFKGGVKLIFKTKLVNKMVVEVLTTKEKDSVMVNEMIMIPEGFSNIDAVAAEKVQDRPATNISNIPEQKALQNYLASGANACLEWDSEGYGKGQIMFDILIDGKQHSYELWLPPMGLNSPSLKIGCLDFPLNLTLISMERINY